jgi:hypothetical protein
MMEVWGGGGGRDFVLQSVGVFFGGLGRSNVWCWSSSMASSGSGVRPVLVEIVSVKLNDGGVSLGVIQAMVNTART